MLLKNRLIAQGGVLFRWRGFLPLALLPLALAALTESGLFEAWFGEAVEEAWDAFCVAVAFSGLAIRVATVGFVPAGTSGRNARYQRADTLNTSGLYSVVRNPLYLGNIVILVALALATKVWWFPLLAWMAAVLHYERIVFAEEAYLQKKFGAAYDAWARTTPALVPNLRGWRRPDLPFSVRSALRREYNGFFLIVVAMTVIEAASDILGEGLSWREWAGEHLHWVVFFAAGTLIFASLRFAKKRTTWLDVPGR